MPQHDNRSNSAGLILTAAIERLRGDREHGASWLARSAAAALAAAAEPEHPPEGESAADRAAEIRRLARGVAYARPGMAAVANTVARTVSAGWPAGASAAHESDAETTAALGRIRQEAERLIAQWEDAARAITSHARALVTPHVFTHSRSGTVERVLTSLAHEGRASLLTVTQSHPGDEGVMTAHTLAAAGWGVTLVPDSAAGVMMGEAGCVVVGADSVRSDGSLINKVGTYLVALAAHAAGVPVYALCETLKIAAPGWPLALDEMDPEELAPAHNLGLMTRNVLFDQTPASLITAIVTERGPLSRAEIEAIAMQAEGWLAALPQ